MTTETDRCEICGSNLKSETKSENMPELECAFCKKSFIARVFCPNHHYVCDECHAKKAVDVLRDFCLTTDLKNPFEIAEKILSHPSFKMYGPEHHVLVPVVLLTAFKNNKCKNQKGELVNNSDIEEAINRAVKIPGGWCGFYGSCGSAIGAGVAFSIFTHATPSKAKERSISNRATSDSLNKISDNLEHCCKRSVRLAITEALKIANEEFGCKLDYHTEKCTFSTKNKICSKAACPFF